MLRCARVPWQWSVGLAPGVSLLIAEVGATTLFLIGASYTPRGMLLALIVACLAAAAVGRLWRRPGSDPGVRARWRWPTYVGLGCGFALLSAPLIVGMGRISTLLQQWDGVFHLSALRAIREHEVASSLWALAPLYQSGSSPSYYPSAFHALMALSPTDGASTLNASIYLFAVVVWGSGLAMLAATIEQRWGTELAIRHGSLLGWVVPVAAAFVSVPAVLFPLLSALPYAVSVVLLPAIVAGVLSGHHRILAAALLAGLGMIVTHPISVASLVLIVGPAALVWFIPRFQRGWRGETTRRDRFRAVSVIVLGAVGALAYWKVTSAVRGFERKTGANPFGEFFGGLIDLTSLWRANDWYLGGIALAVLAISGAVVMWRRLPRWFAAGVSATWALSLLVRAVARSDVWWLQQLASPWYSQAARIAPISTIVMSLLAALALAYLLRKASTMTVVAAVTIFGLVTGGWRTIPRTELVRAAYQPGKIAYGTMVDSDDLEVLTWLRDNGLPSSGALIGDPANGAAFAYGFSKVDSRVRQLTLATLPPYVWSAVMGLSERTAQLCSELRAHGVRYIYLDSATAKAGAKVSEDAPGMYDVDTSGWTQVISSGSVSVWELPDQCQRQ
ncbi:DUF6541 family protein [Bowdeniella massiliensis]|uniref:DUF6541 family protein n=1 Tax=Bowdeniella massiliensis TaxID=2932264 RepID=UPI0032B26C00